MTSADDAAKPAVAAHYVEVARAHRLGFDGARSRIWRGRPQKTTPRPDPGCFCKAPASGDTEMKLNDKTLLRTDAYINGEWKGAKGPALR